MQAKQRSGVRSIHANRPRRAWTRRSTASTRSARPARPISRARRHEGWALVPGDYDDGGFSGGNMDRPGPERLLDEIEAARSTSSSSTRSTGSPVTLATSPRSSMCSTRRMPASCRSPRRSTRPPAWAGSRSNVLLSFAQFEREVTGERIRDKIAASKAKGMWMGGVVPLGYDVLAIASW